MLKELHIQNFAIIDELHLSLEPGFNILTGETGAGKSILIDAVTLLLGGKADTTALRAGANQARVEGLFSLSEYAQKALSPILEREGLEGDSPKELWLARELRASGRTVTRVNGRATAVSVLREIAEGLVDVHGQSEHLSLFRVQEHLNLLDRYAGLEAQRAELHTLVNEIESVRKELRRLQRSEQARMQRIDLLRFQVDEIGSIKPITGELKDLESELIRLNNAEQLSASVNSVLRVLEEGDEASPAVIDLLGQAQRELQALIRIDSSLQAQLDALASNVYQIEDITGAVRDYGGEVEFNPKRLGQVEERISLLRRLERKYGGDLQTVLDYAKAAIAELGTLENSDERIAGLLEQEPMLLSRCAELSMALSQQRQQAAQVLVQGVEVELNDLKMDGARFAVAFNWRPAKDGLLLVKPLPTARTITDEGVQAGDAPQARQVAFNHTGIDRVEFLVAPNIGEGLKPMVKIASGGETARLMLALKTVLSRADRTPTLIFDEIDQGIGGRIGAVVGTKLWQLTTGESDAARHQVLCITHLPQLAAFGDIHFKVHKSVGEGRTTTKVSPLDTAMRTQELAQMLGTQGEVAIQGAQEMLQHSTLIKEQRHRKA